MIAPLLLSLVAAAALALAAGYESWSFGTPGPGLMPVVGAGLMLAASLASFGRDKTDSAPEQAGPGLAGSLPYMAGFVALIPLTLLIGLLPALALVGAAILRLANGYSTSRAAAIAGGVAAASWVIFAWALAVPLPRGLVWGA
ncbi:tripartite tricarboxylate transporter TctB family protein [Phreatobacter sp. AB_2022a]|uniref:tripartite tricarboxylate transporter TctB family protein n=1 Tax=Phreatobacter sp. AB_2022a TaxID=3003134 RepID=UPI00228714E9|nr:tripartite tricarboxylate transporter TctB family protein [Phreatobacter sp. AB_2022a]MCZ0732819.1 tripartite tricarboxylate transporter TctB family protein [Phreatobacter sp. AB_2022a]